MNSKSDANDLSANPSAEPARPTAGDVSGQSAETDLATLRWILEKSPDAGYRRNLQQDRYDYLSPVIEQITGLSPDHFASLSTDEVLARLHRDDRERVMAEVAEAHEQGQGEIVYRFRCQDGRYRWLCDRLTVECDAEGRPLYRGGIVRDVTDEIERRQEQRQTRERFELALELSGVSLFTQDDQLRYTWLYSPHDSFALDRVLGRTDAELFSKEDADGLTRIKRQVLATGETTRQSLPITLRGEKRIWEVILQPLQDAADRVVGVLGAATDITDRWRYEQALRQSEDRFRETFAHAPVGMAITDPQGRFLHVNQAYCDITGYSEQQLLNQNFTFQKLTHPEDLGQYLDRLDALLKGTIPALFVEKRYRRADGREVWVRASGTVRRDVSGQPTQLVGLVEDITARREAEQRLQDLTATLEERVRERAAVAEQRASQLQAMAFELTQAEERERKRMAQILHDGLQQLLVGASFKTELLKSNRHDPDLLERELGQLSDLLRQCIDASRSLSYDLSPPVLYQEGLAAALRHTARQMQEKHGLCVEVVIDADHQLDLPRTLRVLLFQAVRELLFNVVKHAGADRARVWVTSTANRLAIDVSDEGAGFDPAALETETIGGFGLFSIRERIKLLGGDMEIDSTPGQGSRFTLWVPQITREETGPEPSPQAPARPTVAPDSRDAPRPNDHQPLRLLLADDQPIVRSGLASLLGEEPDLEIIGEAGDGDEAINLTRRLRPDVVVMDVSMPEKDGIEATREIHAAWPEVRVVGLSMHEGEQTARAMRDAGAAAFLTKDGPPELLLAAIRRGATTPDEPTRT
ncbi:MAG: PAS domain S-box protein [Phycisphaeraceae bacterium]